MIQLTLENYRQLVEGALTQVLRLAFLKRSTVADLAAERIRLEEILQEEHQM